MPYWLGDTCQPVMRRLMRCRAPYVFVLIICDGQRRRCEIQRMARMRETSRDIERQLRQSGSMIPPIPVRGTRKVRKWHLEQLWPSRYVPLIEQSKSAMPYFENGPIRLFYTSHGAADGPAILLLHGWACDSHDWSHQVPLLTSLGFHVVALDLRGHGRSSAPSDVGEYSMKVFVADIVALLHHLHIASAVIVAHSMSTVIASMLAVERPDLVAALVLVHPIYCGTPPALAAMSEAMSRDPEAAPGMVAGFFEKHMYTPRTPEWLITWHLRRVLGSDGVALAGCGQAIVDLFGSVVGQTDAAREFMRKRVAPRLVVATEVLPAAAEWEAELGLGFQEECHTLHEGTFSHVVDSERFNDILSAWLLKRELAKEQDDVEY